MPVQLSWKHCVQEQRSTHNTQNAQSRSNRIYFITISFSVPFHFHFGSFNHEISSSVYLLFRFASFRVKFVYVNRAMAFSNGPFVSVFKINGKPILPPVVCITHFAFAFCHRSAQAQAPIEIQLLAVLMLRSVETLLFCKFFV